MISVERPSEIGTPQWKGPQQRQLRFALDSPEVDEYQESRDGEHYAAHYEHFRWYRTRPDRMSEAERAKYYFL